MCSKERHPPRTSPVGTAYFAPTGLNGGSGGGRSTHITLLRSEKLRVFNERGELNSPGRLPFPHDAESAAAKY